MTPSRIFRAFMMMATAGLGSTVAPGCERFETGEEPPPPAPPVPSPTESGASSRFEQLPGTSPLGARLASRVTSFFGCPDRCVSDGEQSRVVSAECVGDVACEIVLTPQQPNGFQFIPLTSGTARVRVVSETRHGLPIETRDEVQIVDPSVIAFVPFIAPMQGVAAVEGVTLSYIASALGKLDQLDVGYEIEDRLLDLAITGDCVERIPPTDAIPHIGIRALRPGNATFDFRVGKTTSKTVSLVVASLKDVRAITIHPRSKQVLFESGAMTSIKMKANDPPLEIVPIARLSSNGFAAMSATVLELTGTSAEYRAFDTLPYGALTARTPGKSFLRARINGVTLTEIAIEVLAADSPGEP